MYNETYEDYIRSILGYPNNGQGNGYMTDFDNRNIELEECYPDIYKKVYPLVKAKCNECRSNVTNEDIERMTDEIYFAIEQNEEIQININVNNEVRSTNQQTRTTRNTNTRQPEVKAKPPLTEKRETRQINRGLRDIIKILLIRELLNRFNRPGPRPPYGRPPFGPGPGPRPPFRPGDGPRTRKISI